MAFLELFSTLLVEALSLLFPSPQGGQRAGVAAEAIIVVGDYCHLGFPTKALSSHLTQSLCEATAAAACHYLQNGAHFTLASNQYPTQQYLCDTYTNSLLPR